MSDAPVSTKPGVDQKVSAVPTSTPVISLGNVVDGQPPTPTELREPLPKLRSTSRALADALPLSPPSPRNDRPYEVSIEDKESRLDRSPAARRSDQRLWRNRRNRRAVNGGHGNMSSFCAMMASSSPSKLERKSVSFSFKPDVAPKRPLCVVKHPKTIKAVCQVCSTVSHIAISQLVLNINGVDFYIDRESMTRLPECNHDIQCRALLRLLRQSRK
jgi:hypothetical protein